MAATFEHTEELHESPNANWDRTKYIKGIERYSALRGQAICQIFGGDIWRFPHTTMHHAMGQGGSDGSLEGCFLDYRSNPFEIKSHSDSSRSQRTDQTTGGHRRTRG